MTAGRDPTSDEILERLGSLIVIGRRYEAFAREHPSAAAAQIAELNGPGLVTNAWDLRWVPAALRPRIARAASTIIVQFCGSETSETENSALMDILMPTAIVAACVVADSFGIPIDFPSAPLPGHLDRWSRLLATAVESPKPTGELMVCPGVAAVGLVELRIASCLPPVVRGRLSHLADLMDHYGFMESRIPAVIFLIGAVATDAFETLDF